MDEIEKRRGGAWNVGHKNPSALLTEEQARAIFFDQRPVMEICAEYGVGDSAVYGIKSGRAWKSLGLTPVGVKLRPKSQRRNTFYTDDPDNFWRMAEKASPDECWPWKGALTTSGYGQVKLDGRCIAASRAAWLLTNGDPGELHVLHDCHNPACVNPGHLHLGTVADNMQEMAKAGRAHKGFGEKNPQSKLTDAQVRAIRADRRPQREILAEYGIGSSTLSQIRTRKRWPHIED